jgi:hypothetical protein
MSGSSRLRGVLANLALAGVSVLVVLAVFEVGLRLAGYRAIYEVYSKPSAFWQPDPLLGWAHEPGAEGVFVGPRPWPIEFRTPVRINSLGLRGPEVGPREPGELRVLFMGDSMVAAFEVPHEDTFVARVGTLLEARLDRPVRTINAGVRGYGTDQSLLWFEDRGHALDADVVVFLHAGNDRVNNKTLHRMRRELGKPAFALHSDGSLELVGAPVPEYPVCSEVQLSDAGRIEEHHGAGGRAVCALQMALFDHSALLSYLTLRVPWDPHLLRRLYYLGTPGGPGARPADAGPPPIPASDIGRTTALIQRLARAVRRQGSLFVLLSEEHALRHLDVEALAGTETKPVSLGPIESEDPRTIRWRHDSHFNSLGHGRIAEFLTDLLIQRMADRTASGGEA